MTTDRSQLLIQLERSQQLGFLGSGPVEPQLDHAIALIESCAEVDGGALLDLGSGGGLPGLAALLDDRWHHIALLDRSARRCAFLRTAVAQLRAADRVVVLRGEAETLARDTELRGCFDAVVARSFGPPAATVECASGFVRRGGVVVLADPPSGRSWPSGVTELGLVVEFSSTDQVSFTRFRSADGPQPGFPRPPGRPVKRPLW